MKNLFCALGFHSWKYSSAKYDSTTSEKLAIPMQPAKRICTSCGKRQVEDKHCLGLNPPEYYSRWYDVQ